MNKENTQALTGQGGGLRRENLTRADYTNSLVTEAMRAGLLTEEETERIRGDLMNALAEIISLATNGESDSVKTDSARQYVKSLLYNIDTYLLAAGSPEEALRLLKERRMSELYGYGYRINCKNWEDAKHLWPRVRYTRLKNADESYNKALDTQFRNYLASYDPRTGAHDRIYLSLPRYGIRGAFHIDGAVEVLKKLLALNEGKTPDAVVIEGSQPISGLYGSKKAEENS